MSAARTAGPLAPTFVKETASARAFVGALQRAADFDACQAPLDVMTKALAMSRAAWAPDIALPYGNVHMDRFLRRQGWPDELIRLWWNKNMCLRMPLYVRCRLEHVPFVADLQSRVGRNAQSVTHEERQFNESVIALGHSTLIAVPIHLPKSQVALLLWVGARPISELRLLLDHVGPDLLAAGHYFMRAFARQHGQNGRTMEELSRLTPREWDCLRMTAQGYREAEVAKLEGIGATTVRYHLDNAVKKLGVANRTQAIARAVQLGMLGAIGE